MTTGCRFKATRDGVADWLGVDDGDKRLSWRYAQAWRAEDVPVRLRCLPPVAVGVMTTRTRGRTRRSRRARRSPAEVTEEAAR